MSDPAWLIVLVSLIGGALKVSTPFIFVSLGEAITEKSGRINLGLEGTLVFGAMAGYAAAYHTGNAWVGVVAAAIVGSAFGLLHGLLCSLPKVNDVALGIALMVLGLGLAFFLGKAYVQPTAPRLQDLQLGEWSSSPIVQTALRINVLFFIGLGLTLWLSWALVYTRWGMQLRAVGDSAPAAKALGLSLTRTRISATAIGGALAGIGGSFLSLYYPGSWNEALSSGQGIMAVALVIFARWNPLGCFAASLLFGAASSVGPALQAVGISQGYHLWNAAPYVLTLLVMLITVSPTRALRGAPGELTLMR